MIKIYYNKLKELHHKKELVSIHSDIACVDKFVFGYVVACNKQYYVMALIAPDGKYDGFLLKPLSDIQYISYNDKYEIKMKKLIDYYKTEHENCELLGENLVKELLEFAQDNGFIIAIEISDSGYDDCVGYVEQISDDICIIKNIDKFGKEDGESVISLDNITQISCNTEDEIKLKILSEN